MASPTSGAPILPDYAPVPRASLGPAVNDQGYYVGRIERNLYWVTDGDYHDTLMLVDIVLPGWAPFYGINLSEDVPGYMAAPATALSYPWKHLIAGHLGRLGTRDDVTLHRQYIADIETGARTALGTVDPTPYFAKYGENLWAAVKGYLDAVAEIAAAPVIEKYTGVLGAADVFTVPTAFSILASIRLDLGYRMDIHP